MEELLKELMEELGLELEEELHGSSDEVLLFSKIKSAYLSVKRKRNYQDHHTQDFIDEDMKSMHDIIKELAIYDWNHVGGEGETSHSENGTSRTWHPRNDILAAIVPFVQIL